MEKVFTEEKGYKNVEMGITEHLGKVKTREQFQDRFVGARFECQVKNIDLKL